MPDGEDTKVRHRDIGLLLQQKGPELDSRQNLPLAHQGEKDEVGKEILKALGSYNVSCTLLTTSKGELSLKQFFLSTCHLPGTVSALGIPQGARTPWSPPSQSSVASKEANQD